MDSPLSYLTRHHQRDLLLQQSLPPGSPNSRQNPRTPFRANSYTVLLVGPSGVGKTSLARREALNTFTNSDTSDDVTTSTTSAERFYTKVEVAIANSSTTTVVPLELVDTVGQERFATLPTVTYRHMHAVLLCYRVAAVEVLVNTPFVQDLIVAAPPRDLTRHSACMHDACRRRRHAPLPPLSSVHPRPPRMEAGIQELRKAEEAATAKVEKARKERIARMKLAKQEADKEITSYRAEMDAKLAQLEKEALAAEGAQSEAALNAEANKAIAQMNKDCEANWNKVADMLIGVVMKVEMKIPEARKGVSQE